MESVRRRSGGHEALEECTVYCATTAAGASLYYDGLKKTPMRLGYTKKRALGKVHTLK